MGPSLVANTGSKNIYYSQQWAGSRKNVRSNLVFEAEITSIWHFLNHSREIKKKREKIELWKGFMSYHRLERKWKIPSLTWMSPVQVEVDVKKWKRKIMCWSTHAYRESGTKRGLFMGPTRGSKANDSWEMETSGGSWGLELGLPSCPLSSTLLSDLPASCRPKVRERK